MFDFPETFVTTDAASLEGQRRFIRSTRIQLLLLVVASAAGAFSWTVNRTWDGAALLAGVAFLAAAVLRTVLIRGRPHRVWYDGRAAAESIKTLAWKYSVAGDPFLSTNVDSDDVFRRLSSDVLASFGTLGSAVGSASNEPTQSMRSFRNTPLAERRSVYAKHRIVDQQDYCSFCVCGDSGTCENKKLKMRNCL